MEDYIGVLTFIDHEEKVQADCQFVIGTTPVMESKEEVEQEALELVKEYLYAEYRNNWRITIESGSYGIKLNTCRPGEVIQSLFLDTKTLVLDGDELIFEEQ